MLLPLIPPFRYALVEDEVYRGADPKNRNFRFLKRVISIPVAKVKDNVPLNYSKVVHAIQIIIDPLNLPIFVHCLDGGNVSGLVVACLRKLQMWSVSSAIGEFMRGGVISSEESEFIEKFSGDIEIPRTIPKWLWGGQVTFNKHPTLKLKFLNRAIVEFTESKPKENKVGSANNLGTSGGDTVDLQNYRKRVSTDLLGDLLDPSTNIKTDYDERDEVVEDEVAKLSMTLQALDLEGLKD
ncbi:hypothetical protein G9A89_014587 [Geosiphon pyriformis]|nr:hypothetical protein G9A89_014587 [Geosiphon pyriformis]